MMLFFLPRSRMKNNVCKYYTLKKITNQEKNSIIRKISLISAVAVAVVVAVALSCRSARRKLLGPPQMA